jgi:hypothetical protein
VECTYTEASKTNLKRKYKRHNTVKQRISTVHRNCSCIPVQNLKLKTTKFFTILKMSSTKFEVSTLVCMYLCLPEKILLTVLSVDSYFGGTYCLHLHGQSEGSTTATHFLCTFPIGLYRHLSSFTLCKSFLYLIFALSTSIFKWKLDVFPNSSFGELYRLAL